MGTLEAIKEAAQRLRVAEESGVTCDPVRDLIGITNIESAYEVQKIIADSRREAGAKVLGRKIGLTSEAIQKQLGVEQPDFGNLWDDRELRSGSEFSASKLMQPKAEAEIAFVLGADLDSDDIKVEDVEDAIEYVQASIEIVGSRIEGWNIKITDTIADNASASHWVLGEKKARLSEVDLENCKMAMYNEGKLVSEGIGSNCLGSPLKATVWLANKMKALGQPLRSGDIILTGALGPMVNVKAGDQYRAIIDGLGEVRINFNS